MELTVAACGSRWGLGDPLEETGSGSHGIIRSGLSVHCTALPVWPSLPFVEYIVLGIFPLNLHNNQVKVGILVIFLLMARKVSLGEVKK